MVAGFAIIWGIDRYITPVCPACSHTHNHDSCSTRLHGFAGPLITAALIHSLFDGWTLAAGQSLPGSGSALVAGVLVHKVPESFAYGVILRAALGSRTVALAGVDRAGRHGHRRNPCSRTRESHGNAVARLAACTYRRYLPVPRISRGPRRVASPCRPSRQLTLRGRTGRRRLPLKSGIRHNHEVTRVRESR